jgi:uncharacterized lipoprotein YmbA
MSSSPSSPHAVDLGREILTLIATVNRLDGQIQAQMSNIAAAMVAEREARAVMEAHLREDLARHKTEADARAEVLQKAIDRMAAETHQIKTRIWFASGIAAAVLWIASNILPAAIGLFFRAPAP